MAEKKNFVWLWAGLIIAGAIIIGAIILSSNSNNLQNNLQNTDNSAQQSTSSNNEVQNTAPSEEEKCYMKDPQVSVDWYKTPVNPNNNQCPGWEEVYSVKICNQESQSVDLSYRICDNSGCASLKVYDSIGAYACKDSKNEGSMICKSNMYLTDIEMNKIEVCN